MKTDFDKYISDKIQNIEDNLQVGDWDAFKVYYARNRCIKAIRLIIPIALAASIIIAFVLFDGKRLDNRLNEPNKDFTLIADNTAIIKTKIPECNNTLITWHRPYKETCPDGTIAEEFEQRQDSVIIIKRECENAVPEPVIDTSAQPGDSYAYYEKENVDAAFYKVHKPTVSIGLSGKSGMSSRAGTMIQMGGPGDGTLSGEKENVHYKHLPPITFGVSIGTNLSERLTFITGLDYSLYLSYKEITSSKGARNEMQQIHYLGLPVMCDYTLYSYKSFEWYIGGGLEIEKCISVSSVDKSLKEKNFLWSAVVSTGIEYNINEKISLYCEPYCRYLLSETSLFSYRTDNPIEISANLGIRFDL